MRGITDSVKHLIIINAILFIGTMAVGNNLFYDWFALHFPKNDMFQPWQIITHMFMHGNFMHILFNMFALWMFGTAVEQVLGSKKFLFVYFSAGLGAVLFQLGFYYVKYYFAFDGIQGLGMTSQMIHEIVNINAIDGQYIKPTLFEKGLYPILNNFNFNADLINQNAFISLFEMNNIVAASMVGASGCIMGILAAFGMMNPNAKLMLIFLPIPIKAKYFIPGIIALDVISAISGQSFFSPSNTAYMAHIGGALTGFIIMWYWKRTQFNQNRWDK
ncbi:rhomboid family intramembrane serine protease [Subsaximicrobium wynnwilliamsii]|uniref:Rhomboid family intramembrane serine protease n=1 Tax=Subsaximicrobium wynnwilliamsii TaxID=291179 RepID=A0A5C6ZPR1_9FLAO|nr:rhomboid family intramembrane serine protease [Subsaximicrobium wynnwilliamsii]TXD91331.1 rhomboid family intramembrane serine protease [Subsaximicrobium wynnwilliamsii]TXE04724.1 rhomboid family intramembrane serine protease [Subsaximicrobium wynnwilliamsii]